MAGKLIKRIDLKSIRRRKLRNIITVRPSINALTSLLIDELENKTSIKRHFNLNIRNNFEQF